MASMQITPEAAYQVLRTRDARFDGRLFVGVTSTGIYCRPVCRVRTPLARNCRFFVNAAAAEAQGFRPCLRCRPELAPGLSLMDSSQHLAGRAAVMLAQAVRDGVAADAGGGATVAAVAARLGVTDRHLRRIFAQVHGVSPMDHLSTQRLLLAKQLLTDTTLPVTQVALASGFASVRRFNAAFLQRYRLSPSALRRARPDATPGTESTVLPDTVVRLAFRPPYDREALLAFWRTRALPGVEVADASGYRRTLALVHAGQRLSGWLALRFSPTRDELQLAVAPTLLPALGTLMDRVRQAFDLDAEPALIDPVLAGVGRSPRPGLRLPGAFDGFELACRVILGQQVTVAAARTLTQRLVQAFGQRLATPWSDLDRLFPDAATLALAPAEAIGRLGIVRQRVGALQALARSVHEGRIRLDRAADADATLAALRELPGVGEWTVQLIAMRALAWPDAFPASDIGVLNALGTRDPKQALSLAKAWRPWRAYAVIRLWFDLENP
jgi:AraC family transcriptional regulator, regulatory protein of adaptative response / DNA-3-methyladenine glycosylase II